MKIVLFANTDWYLYNFRLPFAKALVDQGFDVVLVSPPGEYSIILQQAGFRWLSFQFSRRGMNPFAELMTIFRLIKLFRTEKPDAVHLFTIKCVLYGSVAARLSGIQKIFNSITGLGFVFTNNKLSTKFIRRIILLFYRIALKNTWMIFQNGDDQRIFAENHLFKEGHAFLVMGSGVDTTRFTPKTSEEHGLPYIILPARLLRDKGIVEFVQAAKILISENVPCKFVLVGEGDPSNPSSISDEIVQNWQDEGDVEWWGWQNDIPSVMAKATIVCLPSYREGLPRSLVEAAACGKPIIATDVPGCREIVKDGVNGILVPLKDSQALARAVKKLLADPELCQAMGLQGRRLVEMNFSAQVIIQKTLEVYRKCGLLWSSPV
jgi:glycosyltransferase involved in cell wall biosynthesis